MPVTELLNRLARELIQAGPAATWAVLLRAAVGGIHKDVVMGTLACATSWGGQA